MDAVMDIDVPLDWDLVESMTVSREGSPTSNIEGGDTESVNSGRSGTYELRSKYVFVTWSRSRIVDKDEFHRKLMAVLPAHAKVFGCQELHKDGTPHYHAVIRLNKRPHWTDSRKKFMLKLDDGEVDTEAIRILLKPINKSAGSWLEVQQNHCCKNDNPVIFGERMLNTVGDEKSDRKRTFEEIIKEPDPVKAEAMIQGWNPYEYVSRYPAFARFIEDKAYRYKRQRTVKDVSVFDPKS
jgi:hypothetical protein